MIWLGNESITFKHCAVLKLATLLPNLPVSGMPLHNCASLVHMAVKPRDDFSDTPLENPDFVFYFMRKGIHHSGAAVLSEFDTI